jgi:hypothetical protein
MPAVFSTHPRGHRRVRKQSLDPSPWTTTPPAKSNSPRGEPAASKINPPTTVLDLGPARTSRTRRSQGMPIALGVVIVLSRLPSESPPSVAGMSRVSRGPARASRPNVTLPATTLRLPDENGLDTTASPRPASSQAGAGKPVSPPATSRTNGGHPSISGYEGPTEWLRPRPSTPRSPQPTTGARGCRPLGRRAHDARRLHRADNAPEHELRGPQAKTGTSTQNRLA